MWVRGLKQDKISCLFIFILVAPYVGAWIETMLQVQLNYLPQVAPYVGAWIETYYIIINVRPVEVAPYVGAWIETR